MTLANKAANLLAAAAVLFAWIAAAAFCDRFIGGAYRQVLSDWGGTAAAALSACALSLIAARHYRARRQTAAAAFALSPLFALAAAPAWTLLSWYLDGGEAAAQAMLALTGFAVYFAICGAIGEAASRRRPAPAANAARFSFRGDAGEYFRIWAVNILLTAITLGIFSAWAKVRARRYFYGNTYLGGDNFDYHANPKSILVARVIALAVYGVLGTGFLWWLFYDALGWDGGKYRNEIGVILSAGAAYALPLFYAWALVRGSAFNARNSSFCGVRFAFRKNYRLPMYLILLLLVVTAAAVSGVYALIIHGLDRQSILPLNFRHMVAEVEVYGFWRIWYPLFVYFGLYFAAILSLPAVFYLFVKWRAQNHSLGENVRFRFDGALSRFYFYFLIVPLPILSPALWAPFYVLYDRRIDGFEKEMMSFFQDHAVILALVYALYATAALLKLFHDNLSFSGGRFRCDFSAADYGFKIMLPNLLLSILSFGLLIPWARVRRARYLARHLWVEADEGVLDSFREKGGKDKTGALGDAAGDVSGFDFDIALV